MTNKQTAVEWLEEQFVFFLKDIIENKNNILCKNLFEQAKQMEKEQIKDAHLIGLITSMEMEATKQAEQYYNQTYKQQDK